MIVDLPCFRVSVYPSEGKSWNGWVRRWRRAPVLVRDDPEFINSVDRWLPSGGGIGPKEFYVPKELAEFQAGSYWWALEHLQQCYSCFKYNYEYRKVTLLKIGKKLFEIQREWKQVSE
jgi:hypothetical protein